MNAVEFDTILVDGTIKVPDEYKEKLSKNVKVIILSKEKKKISEKEPFSAISIDTRGYKFDREEANER